MQKAVLLSGGLDSTTCLAKALEDTAPGDVLALNVFYGQRHARERRAARAVAAFYGVRLRELNLADIFALSDSSLLAHSGRDIAHASYAEELAAGGGKKPVATYVPFRNGLMLAAAASIADSVGATEIWYGAHADDAAGAAYPDCSVAFVRAMDAAVCEGTGGRIRVVAPFVNDTKAQVLKAGLELAAPVHLTWSCYEGGEHPCGKCATCIDRRKAFEALGLQDPVR